MKSLDVRMKKGCKSEENKLAYSYEYQILECLGVKWYK